MGLSTSSCKAQRAYFSLASSEVLLTPLASILLTEVHLASEALARLLLLLQVRINVGQRGGRYRMLLAGIRLLVKRSVAKLVYGIARYPLVGGVLGPRKLRVL